MILLLLLNLTMLSGLEQLHKHFVFDLENDIKWKALHRSHGYAYENTVLNEEFKIYKNKVSKQVFIPELLQSIEIPPKYPSQKEECIGDCFGSYQFYDDPFKYFTTFLEENAFEPLGDYEFATDVYSASGAFSMMSHLEVQRKPKRMNFVVSAINKKTKDMILKVSLWPEWMRGELQKSYHYYPTSIDKFMVNHRLENILLMLVKNEIPSDVGNLLHKCVKSNFQVFMPPDKKWKFKKFITYLLQNRDLDVDYLKSIADVNQMSSEENRLQPETSPFHSAINNHNPELLSLMIEHSDPDLFSYGKTMHYQTDELLPQTRVNIIHLALRANSMAKFHPEKLMETLKVLLEALGHKRKALLNDKIGGYVLNYAAAYLPFCVVELLIEHGADVLLANPNELNPTEKYGFAFHNDISNEETVKIQHYLDLKIKDFVPKSILSQVDVKKIPSLKRVSFAEKIDDDKRNHCKEEEQKEQQEECDNALTLGPGRAPEPAKIVPPKER